MNFWWDGLEVLLHSDSTKIGVKMHLFVDSIPEMEIFGLLLLWVLVMGTQSLHTKLEAVWTHQFLVAWP